MASRAYQPDQTQAPYRGWSRSHHDRSLQTDALVISYDVFGTFDREPVGTHHVEQVHIGTWPARTDFKTHYAQWLEDSLFDSMPDRMRRHDSYQAIVAMGDRVVPLVAAELRREPSFLFLALEDIVEDDPVPDEARGNLQATVAAWLSWLRK
jgi:hypothetical protein